MSRRHFIACTGNGIERTVPDGEGGWLVDRALQGEDVRCIALDPLDGDILYAGTQGNGLKRSSDGGRSWRSAGLEGQVVKSVAPSPLQRGVLYAGVKPAGMYISSDYGAGWARLDGFDRIPGRRLWFSPAEPPFVAYVQAIALSPVETDVILAGIEFGAVVRSEDGGRTWTGHRKGALRDCHALIFHDVDGSFAYEAGGTGAGAAMSRDGGRTFSRDKAGMDRFYGWACAADPAQPDRWYVSASTSPRHAHGKGGAQARIYRHEAGGGWTRLGGGLPDPLDDMPYALCTDPTSADHLYAGFRSGAVWHSVDAGATFRKLPVSLSAVHRSMILV